MQNVNAKPNKKFRTIGAILSLEKLNNSAMGNPRYFLVIDTAHGVIHGKTKADVMWTYAMPKEDSLCNVVFHITKTGNIVFDDISAMR